MEHRRDTNAPTLYILCKIVERLRFFPLFLTMWNKSFFDTDSSEQYMLRHCLSCLKQTQIPSHLPADICDHGLFFSLFLYRMIGWHKLRAGLTTSMTCEVCQLLRHKPPPRVLHLLLFITHLNIKLSRKPFVGEFQGRHFLLKGHKSDCYLGRCSFLLTLHPEWNNKHSFQGSRLTFQLSSLVASKRFDFTSQNKFSPARLFCIISYCVQYV